jgi:hypothetical protein
VQRSYAIGATRPFGARHIHRIVNTGTVPAVTVHVYAPALSYLTRYAIEDGSLHVLAVERAGTDW